MSQNIIPSDFNEKDVPTKKLKTESQQEPSSPIVISDDSSSSNSSSSDESSSSSPSDDETLDVVSLFPNEEKFKKNDTLYRVTFKNRRPFSPYKKRDSIFFSSKRKANLFVDGLRVYAEATKRQFEETGYAEAIDLQLLDKENFSVEETNWEKENLEEDGFDLFCKDVDAFHHAFFLRYLYGNFDDSPFGNIIEEKRICSIDDCENPATNRCFGFYPKLHLVKDHKPEICENVFCNDHYMNCYYCGSAICHDDKGNMDTYDICCMFDCENEIWVCKLCFYGTNRAGEASDLPSSCQGCEECDPVCQFNEELEECDCGCKKFFCSDHLEPCKDCGRNYARFVGQSAIGPHEEWIEHDCECGQA